MALLNLDRLARREKTLLGVCAVVVIAAILNWVVGHRLRMRSKDIAAETKIAMNYVREYRSILRSKEEVGKEFERFKRYVHKAPDNRTVADEMSTEIEALARETRVRMLDRKPQATGKWDFYEEHVVRVEVEGSMERLMKFFYRLEKSPQLLRVSRMDLTRSGKNKEGSAKAVLLVTKVVSVES